MDKRERYTPKEKSQDKKPVPAKKPSLTSGHEVTSKFNSEYTKPSSSSVSREPAAPTEAPPPPRLVKSFIRKASLQNRVQEFKTTPRLGRAQSSQKAEGLETYRPELLTSSIHKHTQCRIAARAECAIAQGPDLLGDPVGPQTSVYLHESVAQKPEWTSNILLSLCTLL